MSALLRDPGGAHALLGPLAALETREQDLLDLLVQGLCSHIEDVHAKEALLLASLDVSTCSPGVSELVCQCMLTCDIYPIS